MEEKLSDAEIDKLRAIVGMDSESSDYGEEYALNEDAPLPKAPLSGDSSQEPSKQPKKAAGKSTATAPVSVDTELFVKVEEHAAIGGKLAEAKGDMKVIADTVSLLAKAEKLKSEAITRMEAALDKIDAEIEEIESKLVAPEGLNVPEINIASGAADDLFDLRSELDSLKTELGEIKK